MTVHRTLLISLLTLFAFVPGAAIPAQAPQVDPDKGLIVFYRVKNFKGGAIRFNVHRSHGVIGTLTNGSSCTPTSNLASVRSGPRSSPRIPLP